MVCTPLHMLHEDCQLNSVKEAKKNRVPFGYDMIIAIVELKSTAHKYASNFSKTDLMVTIDQPATIIIVFPFSLAYIYCLIYLIL